MGLLVGWEDGSVSGAAKEDTLRELNSRFARVSFSKLISSRVCFVQFTTSPTTSLTLCLSPTTSSVLVFSTGSSSSPSSTLRQPSLPPSPNLPLPSNHLVRAPFPSSPYSSTTHPLPTPISPTSHDLVPSSLTFPPSSPSPLPALPQKHPPPVNPSTPPPSPSPTPKPPSPPPKPPSPTSQPSSVPKENGRNSTGPASRRTWESTPTSFASLEPRHRRGTKAAGTTVLGTCSRVFSLFIWAVVGKRGGNGEESRGSSRRN